MNAFPPLPSRLLANIGLGLMVIDRPHHIAFAVFGTLAAAVLAAAQAVESEPPDPTIRPSKSELVHSWDFDETTEAWQARHECRLAVDSGWLRIESTGDDPYMDCAVDFVGGETIIELRVRSKHASVGSVYWTTDGQPQRGEDKRCDFDMPGGGEWATTRASLTAAGRIRDLRIDPGTQSGSVDIDWIRVVHRESHPIALSVVEQHNGIVRFTAVNRAWETVRFRCGDEAYVLESGKEVVIERRASGTENLEAVSCEIACEGWPLFQRSVWVTRHEGAGEWIDRRLGVYTMSLAREGDVAIIRQGEQVVATLGPLVCRDGKAVPLAPDVLDERIVLRGSGVLVTLSDNDNELEFVIEADDVVEGPVVHVPGQLEQGLLAGLEYLGKGEISSSKLDIESDEHVRFAPDRLKVTMPLMAFVTDQCSIAMTWEDMALQPMFATPNFIDGTSDSRMSLKGKRIRATIRVSSEPLHEAIAWCISKQGLPPLPSAPRTKQQQQELCLAAFDGPLRSPEGWGHCLQPNWVRRPYCDIASTVWRLRGEVAPFGHLDPGGGHIANGTIYFVTGQAEQWLHDQRQAMRSLISGQQADGGYVYIGPYARGHFENTASGLCATPAARLLEFAYQTGDKQALAAGVKTLEYMRRFRTPRGAQTWECPLHTPDQLASAYLVWAYTRGFELTGNKSYLSEARKWALSGLPFTYLWSEYPIMLYATPPVYGATNWVAPNWMGLPVQWVGGVYAYALCKLAPHDSSVDWRHVARGILISAQQQQYPDGTAIGLLPDSFHLRHQRRQPADINPSGLVSLQLAVDGEVDFLSVARDGRWVVAAPFPVTLADGKARVVVREGVGYQVLINGERVIDVNSVGIDEISLQE